MIDFIFSIISVGRELAIFVCNLMFNLGILLVSLTIVWAIVSGLYQWVRHLLR